MAMIEAMACGTTCVVNGDYWGFAEAELRAPRARQRRRHRGSRPRSRRRRRCADDVRIDASELGAAVLAEQHARRRRAVHRCTGLAATRCTSSAPRDVAIVAEPVAAPGSGEVLVQTVVSAISPGTELLVYRGEVPSGMALDASIDGLRSAARFPLKYGYSTVGRVVALGPGVDEGWRGRLAFCLHPHESHFLARDRPSCTRCRTACRPRTPRCTRARRRR